MSPTKKEVAKPRIRRVVETERLTIPSVVIVRTEFKQPKTVEPFLEPLDQDN